MPALLAAAIAGCAAPGRVGWSDWLAPNGGQAGSISTDEAAGASDAVTNPAVPAGPGGVAEVARTGTLTLVIRVPAEVLPGYTAASVPGGGASIAVMLSNPVRLGPPRTQTIGLVAGQTLYPVSFGNLPLGDGYSLEAEVRTAGGTRLAYGNQLDPAANDPALGAPRTANPFTTPPQTFSITSGTNTVALGMRILPVSGTLAGPAPGMLAGGVSLPGGYKRTLSVTAPVAVPAGYVATLALNTAALVSGGKLRPDLADLRVLVREGTTLVEIDREVENPNTASTQVRFRLRRAIGTGDTDSGYLLTYGSYQGVPAPEDRSRIYDVYEGFEYGSTADLVAGGWTPINGQAPFGPAGAPAGRSGQALRLDSRAGDFYRDLLFMCRIPRDYAAAIWFYDDLDTTRNDWVSPFTDTGVIPLAVGSYTAVTSTLFDYYALWNPTWTATTLTRTTGWHRLEWRRYRSTTTLHIDGATIASGTEARTMTGFYLRTGGISGYSALAYWDDLSVRAYVSPEPTIALAAEEAL